MAEVLNEHGLVEYTSPKPHRDPNLMRRRPGDCNEGRAFTDDERKAIEKRWGTPQLLPLPSRDGSVWVPQAEITVIE